MAKQLIYLCCSFLIAFACPTTSIGGSVHSPTSFAQLVGQTDWQIRLKGFTISQRSTRAVFSLRVGDGHHLSYRGHSVGPESKSFGPFTTGNTAILSNLLNRALAFSGQSRAREFSLSINWFYYPESLRSWANRWQGSSLKADWNSVDRQARYKRLTGMIGDHLRRDMALQARTLGFTITGAAMEKMSFFRPAQIATHAPTFDRSELPGNTKIPIPLMLTLSLKPTKPRLQAAVSPATPVTNVAVDYIFATAQRHSATVYCSYQRALDEYEISGDTRNADDTYSRVRPLSEPAYHPIADQLLSGCLKASDGDLREKISLRINMSQFPEVQDDAIKHFTFKSGPPEKARLFRAGMPNRQFHLYKPRSTSLLPTGMTTFMKRIGYTFDSFEMSLESKRKASEYPDFAQRFKPMGLTPDHRPSVPDIVYMILKKN